MSRKKKKKKNLSAYFSPDSDEITFSLEKANYG